MAELDRAQAQRKGCLSGAARVPRRRRSGIAGRGLEAEREGVCTANGDGGAQTETVGEK
jgi:hypothetical protein